MASSEVFLLWGFFFHVFVCVTEQVQFRRQVFLAGAHQAFDGDYRRLHNPSRIMARQETESAQPEGHDVGHLSEQITRNYNWITD